MILIITLQDYPLTRWQLRHNLGHHLVVVLRLEGLRRDDGLHADLVQAVLELGRLVGGVYVHLQMGYILPSSHLYETSELEIWFRVPELELNRNYIIF